MVDEAAYPSACTLNTHYRIVSYLVSLTLIVVFAARCYASAAYPVMRCLSVCCVCVSVTFVHSVKMNKYIFKIFSPSGSHTILVFLYQTAQKCSGGNPPPPNRGVECKWGRQKARFWANIWLYCVLRSVPAAGAIHLAATNRGEFITLVAGKRPSLLWTKLYTAC